MSSNDNDKTTDSTSQETQHVSISEDPPISLPLLTSLRELILLPRNPKKNKKISINLTGNYYPSITLGTKYSVILHVTRDIFFWNCIHTHKELPDDWNIQWYDTYITPETLKSMLPFQKINHFPGSVELGRKNLLCRNLAKLRKYLPNEYSFVPKTWLIPHQLDELREYVAPSAEKGKKKPVFIVKPEASCQGRGIYLTKQTNHFGYSDHCVVQEYIKDPFLIDGLKFDLRIYALVKSVAPLKIFIYREGMARFATVKYEKPKKINMKNLCMHLTNYAVNKKNPEFQPSSDTDDGIGHKRSFTSILRTIKEMGKDPDPVFRDICNVISKTIISVHPHLLHTYKACQPKDEYTEMCFELFGFDIMLDSSLKAWLLEVNHTPSFHTDSSFDFELKKNLIVDTLHLANLSYYESKSYQYLEKKFSKLTPEDVAKLQSQIKSYEDQNLGGYYRIFPNPELLNFKPDYLMDTAKIAWNEFISSKKKTEADMKELNSQLLQTHAAFPQVRSRSNNLSMQIQNPSLNTREPKEILSNPATTYNSPFMKTSTQSKTIRADKSAVQTIFERESTAMADGMDSALINPLIQDARAQFEQAIGRHPIHQLTQKIAMLKRPSFQEHRNLRKTGRQGHSSAQKATAEGQEGSLMLSPMYDNFGNVQRNILYVQEVSAHTTPTPIHQRNGSGLVGEWAKQVTPSANVTGNMSSLKDKKNLSTPNLDKRLISYAHAQAQAHANLQAMSQPELSEQEEEFCGSNFISPIVGVGIQNIDQSCATPFKRYPFKNIPFPQPKIDPKYLSNPRKDRLQQNFISTQARLPSTGSSQNLIQNSNTQTNLFQVGPPRHSAAKKVPRHRFGQPKSPLMRKDERKKGENWQENHVRLTESLEKKNLTINVREEKQSRLMFNKNEAGKVFESNSRSFLHTEENHYTENMPSERPLSGDHNTKLTNFELHLKRFPRLAYLHKRSQNHNPETGY